MKIAPGDGNLTQCDHVWRQVLDDRWFQAEVHNLAARLVGGGVEEPQFRDLVQEVSSN